MASIEECVTQLSIIKFAFNELTIDKSADKWTAKCKICKQKLIEKRGTTSAFTSKFKVELSTTY